VIIQFGKAKETNYVTTTRRRHGNNVIPTGSTCPFFNICVMCHTDTYTDITFYHLHLHTLSRQLLPDTSIARPQLLPEPES